MAAAGCMLLDNNMKNERAWSGNGQGKLILTRCTSIQDFISYQCCISAMSQLFPSLRIELFCSASQSKNGHKGSAMLCTTSRCSSNAGGHFCINYITFICGCAFKALSCDTQSISRTSCWNTTASASPPENQYGTLLRYWQSTPLSNPDAHYLVQSHVQHSYPAPFSATPYPPWGLINCLLHYRMEETAAPSCGFPKAN